jgi:ADP-heptose:LPS heptosyltransferase
VKKNWPLAHFRAVAERSPLPVRFCTSPENPFVGAVHIPDLYQLARWLKSARAYVGNDSGISHLAAAVGTPVVAMFGPTNPAVWAPRGPVVRTLPLDSSVDSALQALHAVLD